MGNVVSFIISVFEVIEAVPPPFLPLLMENKKLKLGGEASVRKIGASVPSQVSVKNRQSIFLSKIRSLTIKVLFKRDRIFSSAMLIVCGELGSVMVDGRGVCGLI